MQAMRSVFVLPVALVLGLSVHPPSSEPETDFGAVFDEHWERLRDDYPYFELYGVDWDAERAEHRPRAAAAENAGELAWEIARLLSVLKDPHVEYMPPVDLIQGWAIPELRTAMIGHKPYVVDWGLSLIHI